MDFDRLFVNNPSRQLGRIIRIMFSKLDLIADFCGLFYEKAQGLYYLIIATITPVVGLENRK